jgi:hypothetical protein
MDRSKLKGEDIDDEYERHIQPEGGRWDTRCRIKHGQSTWYISCLGRSDIHEKILRLDGYCARKTVKPRSIVQGVCACSLHSSIFMAFIRFW